MFKLVSTKFECNVESMFNPMVFPDHPNAFVCKNLLYAAVEPHLSLSQKEACHHKAL